MRVVEKGIRTRIRGAGAMREERKKKKGENERQPPKISRHEEENVRLSEKAIMAGTRGGSQGRR